MTEQMPVGPVAARCPQRRNFAIFLAGQVASQSAVWLQIASLAWIAVVLTGSGTAVGWILAAAFGPLLVLGPLTGALVDRVGKHRLLIATQFLVVCQAVTFGSVVLTDSITMVSLYGLTLVFGLLHCVENPLRRAFLAEIVAEERISRAVGFNSAITSAGRVLGPASAGGLIVSAGIGWCFVVAAAGHLLALGLLLLIRRSALILGEASKEPRPVRAGLCYAWNTTELRITLILTAALAVFGFNHQVLIPSLAEQSFGGGVGAYTLMLTAVGVGSIAGALLVARRRDVDVAFLLRAAMVFATANAAVALAPNLAAAVPACAVAGAAASHYVTAASALLQRRCSPAMRGRVTAMSAMVVLGGLPIGGPIIGWVCDHAGPRAGLAVGSGAAVLATALIGGRLSQGRRAHPGVVRTRFTHPSFASASS